MRDSGGFLIIAVLGIVFFIILGIFSGEGARAANREYTRGLNEGVKSYQIEAVEVGVGEWIVDTKGNTEFRWKIGPEGQD
jgi:hypothetical protein